jgi:hypothetical protein
MPVSTEFTKIMTDFVRDMNSSFPELSMIINKWWQNGENIDYVYNYCLKVYPDKFVDILYKSDELFNQSQHTEFLPGVSFSHIWNYNDISDKNREMIWNYLQMVMISIIGDIRQQNLESSTIDEEETIKNTTLDLYEKFNTDEFNIKLKETITSLQETLENNNNNNTLETPSSDDSSENESSPTQSKENPFDSIMDTKLASLAKEIALETTEDFKDGLDNVKDVNGVFEHLFKDPSKIMNIVKNVSEKLDVKLQNGDFNEKEILSEAVSLMGKMKTIPGMENIQSLMKNIQQQPKPKSSRNKAKGRTFNTNSSNNNQDDYLNQLYDQMIKQQKENKNLQQQQKQY